MGLTKYFFPIHIHLTPKRPVHLLTKLSTMLVLNCILSTFQFCKTKINFVYNLSDNSLYEMFYFSGVIYDPRSNYHIFFAHLIYEFIRLGL